MLSPEPHTTGVIDSCYLTGLREPWGFTPGAQRTRSEEDSRLHMAFQALWALDFILFPCFFVKSAAQEAWLTCAPCVCCPFC